MLVLQKIDVRRSLRRAHQKRSSRKPHWRPTVVAVATDKLKTRVLLVTNHDTPYWGFPKGGIERKDNFDKHRAVRRELDEELRIPEGMISWTAYIASVLDEQRGSTRRRKFEIGKQMHCLHVVLHEDAQPIPDEAHHVSEFRWVTSWAEFEGLPMTNYRRKMWRLVLLKLEMAWKEQQAA